MGYFPCRACGALRKWGDYITDDGSHVPACLACGDAEYVERWAVLTEEENE